MSAGQAGLRVMFDEKQHAYGVVGPNGEFVDWKRYELKPDAEEHLDWLARAAAQ